MKITSQTYEEYAKKYVDLAKGDSSKIDTWEEVRDSLKEYSAVRYGKRLGSMETLCDALIKSEKSDVTDLGNDPDPDPEADPDDEIFDDSSSNTGNDSNENNNTDTVDDDVDTVNETFNAPSAPKILNIQASTQIQAPSANVEPIKSEPELEIESEPEPEIEELEPEIVPQVLNDVNIQGRHYTSPAFIEGVHVEISQIRATDSYISVMYSEDVNVSNFISEGIVPNAGLALESMSAVYIKDSTFGASGVSGLAVLSASNMLVENCTFSGKTRYGIVIHQNFDNAVVTIKNCSFENADNPLMIQNQENTTMTITFDHCSFKNYKTAGLQGIVQCRDILSNNTQELLNNNFFGPEKINIMFDNCTDDNGQVITLSSVNPEEYLGTDNDNQLVFIYAENLPSHLVIYAPERFPVVKG